MRKIIIISVFSIFIFSCATQKRCYEKYPPVVTIKDSCWVETIHDSVKVFVPYQNVVFDTTLNEIPVSLVFHHTSSKGSLHQTIDIKNGRITQKCIADSLELYIEFLKNYYHEQIKIVESHIKDCDKIHRTGYDYFCRWWFLITAILLLLILIYLAVKAYFKPL